MNQDQLEMLKRLKAPIDKYMGPWRIGDKCYSIYHSQTGFIIDTSQNSYRYTHVVFDSGMEVKCKVDNMGMYLRIPPFATPGEKRCLWDMVDWTKWYRDICANGNLCLKYKYPSVGERINFEADPYTAILKALIVQEGV